MIANGKVEATKASSAALVRLILSENDQLTVKQIQDEIQARFGREVHHGTVYTEQRKLKRSQPEVKTKGRRGRPPRKAAPPVVESQNDDQVAQEPLHPRQDQIEWLHQIKALAKGMGGIDRLEALLNEYRKLIG